MKSKKGANFLKLIFAIPIIALMGFFGVIGLYEIGSEFVIDDIHNITKDIAQDQNVSSGFITNMDNYKNNYDTIDFNFDEILFSLIFVAFISSLFVAIKSDPLPTFNFFSYVTVGLMFMLLLMSFVDQVTTWFINDFMDFILDDTTITTPFMDWYFENISFIHMIWFALLLLLNQFGTKIISKIKRSNPFKQDLEEEP